MADSKEIQALGKISSEVDESQVKIIVSSQCIKAQAFLVERLRKEIERQKEVCKFTSRSNIKLEAEIKNAEQELKSLMKALDSIKSANVDLKKEWLLSKESKAETFERVKNGEKKYEDMWLQCKNRYESIPYVQLWIQSTKKMDSLKETINYLKSEAHVVANEIKTKKNDVIQQDRKNIVMLAKFFIQEFPAVNKVLREKTIEIEKLTSEILKYQESLKNALDDEIQSGLTKTNDKEDNIMVVDDEWPNLCKNERNVLMPKLKLINIDLDVLSEKLDQMKKVNIITPITIDSQPGKSLNNTPIKKVTYDNCSQEVYSSYFNKIGKSTNEIDNKSEIVNEYSKRKLINIIEDIKLDKNEVNNIVSKVNPLNLQGVDFIKTDVAKKKNKPVESEEVEEIDMTMKSSQNILIPPTQFSDLTNLTEKKSSSSQQHVDLIVHMSMNGRPQNYTGMKSSQDKKVTFDFPVSQLSAAKENEEEGCDLDIPEEDNKVENETICSQLDDSSVSDGSFAKIRDMMLKKHNLDLSPQFSYAKNTLHTKIDEKVVTSKFFKESEQHKYLNLNNLTMSLDDQDQGDNIKASGVENIGLASQVTTQHDNKNDKDNPTQTGSKEMNDTFAEDVSISKCDKSVTGLLFTHGPQGIPDSLNVSISTTFEEADADFPHGIDSNLLLSPTADLPIPLSDDKNAVTSQEVPNFLTGLQKTGLSFFGNRTSSANKQTNQDNNFTFNFGGNGDDKKSRSGLFSMFR